MSIDDYSTDGSGDNEKQLHAASTNRKTLAANRKSHQVVEMPSVKAKKSSISISDLQAKHSTASVSS